MPSSARKKTTLKSKEPTSKLHTLLSSTDLYSPSLTTLSVHSYGTHHDPHSFPTRRSSDLRSPSSWCSATLCFSSTSAREKSRYCTASDPSCVSVAAVPRLSPI